MPKNAKKYNCKFCDFNTSKRCNYTIHLSTAKHKILTNPNTINANKSSLQVYECSNCNKLYKHISTLSAHKKKCFMGEISIEDSSETIILDASNNDIKMLTNLVLEVVKSNTELQKQNTELQKQNQEFQKQVLDVCQKIQPSTINHTTNNNNNNKTFNLQFFLNEQCKDAMNVTEFVNSFKLNLEDLERVGRQGYVDGISYIILSKLKETDIYKRPFHCSDAKRETLYVKDANGWEREGAENAKMIKAVKDVGQKNFPILNDYRLLHPECIQADSEYNDKYVQMMIQAAGSQKDNVNKVIKKIAKEVTIEKRE
jgi:hypothetical protein